MDKLADFRQEASVGAQVTLRLSRGEDVSGRVAQLDGDCVKIKADGKSVTIYPDILVGWDVHHREESTPAPHDRTDSVSSKHLRATERGLASPSSPTGSPSRPARPPDTSSESAVTPPTTDQLQALQRRFRYGRPDFRHGRIKSFRNQRFGFIQEDAGDAVFFRINDVSDDGLNEALLNESWRTSGEVEFKVHQSPGHKYRHATEIVRTSTESLLQRARSHLDTGQLAQAMGCVRRALQADPADNTARVLEAEIGKGIQKQLRSGTGLPRGNGPYARAKRVQLVNQDPDKAEQLFRQAIRTHDKKESAIKDLSSLLHQHGRTNEAIALLTEHAEQFKHDTSFDNMLATLYQHADRHEEALEVLTKLLDSTAGAKRVPLLRRAAYCYIRCQRYLDAEHALQDLLSIDPHNRTAARWRAELEDARNSGTEPHIIGIVGTLGEEGVEFSLLAHAAIDQCTYDGVDRKKLQSGTAGHKEALHVLELARNVGIKRPRDQAAYYLSAAALLKHHTDGDQSTQIYECLRKYFASMADLYWGERKPADVVRTYYIESLALVSENHDYEAWRILFRYLETFSRGLPDKGNVRFPRASHNEDSDRQKRKDAIRKILELVASDAPTVWMDGLLAVGSQSSFAEATIGQAIHASRSLQAAVLKFFGRPSPIATNVEKRWKAQCEEYRQNWRKRLTTCRTMTKFRATAADMEDLRSQLRGFFDSTRSELDGRRLTLLIDIVEPTLAFCRASDFEERQQNFLFVVQQADDFRKAVVDAPTQYSHDGLLPISDHLKALIEEEFAAIAQTSGAELTLRDLGRKYARGKNGELKLQIEVSNKAGCSPASSVRIVLGPEDSEYFVADNRESAAISTLRGGGYEVTQMIVQPREAALQDRAFPIKAIAKYQNTLGEPLSTEEHSWTVRLYPDDAFHHVDNLYTPFAEGGPVDKPGMFVGRDEQLADLERLLLAGSASKSIVMFGQKRAGKSSLIEHL